MPIWLRKFTFQQLQEYYDKQNKQYENTLDNKSPKKKEILKPAVKPNYSTKTSNK